MLSSPSAAAGMAIASIRAPIAAPASFSFMFSLPLLVLWNFIAFLVEEKEQCNNNHRQQEKRRRNSVNFRGNHPPKLSQHIGWKGILACRFNEFGNDHVI